MNSFVTYRSDLTRRASLARRGALVAVLAMVLQLIGNFAHLANPAIAAPASAATGATAEAAAGNAGASGDLFAALQVICTTNGAGLLPGDNDTGKPSKSALDCLVCACTAKLGCGCHGASAALAARFQLPERLSAPQHLTQASARLAEGRDARAPPRPL